MSKKQSNNFICTFKIFFTSIKTYFLYLDQCTKYLAFPIFGQLISTAILFIITYHFTNNLDKIRAIAPFFQEDKNLLIIFGIILLPPLIVLVKAVYDYIIAFSSLNLLFYTVSDKKKVKDIDFKANNKVIERRILPYVLLMLLVSIIVSVPPFILGIFLCLVFQIFALESDNSIFKCLSRSFELVTSNLISCITMLILCYCATYWFLPQVFIWAFDKISVTHFLINQTFPIVELLPLNLYNELLSIVNIQIDSITISKYIIESAISFVIIGFTLPFRCCCFTELYRLFDSKKIKEFSKNTDEIIKRATDNKRK